MTDERRELINKLLDDHAQKCLSVLGAAIRTEDGVIHFMPRPNRHHHIIHALAQSGYQTPIGGIQGFLTDRGFMNRTDTLMHIRFKYQWDKPLIGSILTSEDMW